MASFPIKTDPMSSLSGYFQMRQPRAADMQPSPPQSSGFSAPGHRECVPCPRVQSAGYDQERDVLDARSASAYRLRSAASASEHVRAGTGQFPDHSGSSRRT